MSLEKVQQGLIHKLVTAFPTWSSRIAWQNKPFAPTQGQPWLAVFFMPVEERVATIGTVGLDQNEGLFQIDINYPENMGEGDSRETINLLRACFRPQSFNYGGQAVSILSRSPGGGRQADGYFKIPFTVRWRAQINRTA